MSFSELLVIAIGLIVGWAVVSRIVTAYAREPHKISNGDWFEILGVPPDATSDQIDAAYERKRRELSVRELRIMTTPEQKKAAQQREYIDSAYHRSKRLRAE